MSSLPVQATDANRRFESGAAGIVDQWPAASRVAVALATVAVTSVVAPTVFVAAACLPAPLEQALAHNRPTTHAPIANARLVTTLV